MNLPTMNGRAARPLLASFPARPPWLIRRFGVSDGGERTDFEVIASCSPASGDDVEVGPTELAIRGPGNAAVEGRSHPTVFISLSRA